MMIDVFARAGFPLDGPAFWLALFLAVAAVFFAYRAHRAASRAAHLRNELERERIALAAAREQAGALDALRDDLACEQKLREAAERDAAVAHATIAERERALAELKQRMETEFRATTAQLLEGANEAFLKRAAETFQRYRENAENEGEMRRKALDDMLKPVSETLARYQKGLDELRKEQTESRGALASQIGQLAKTTQDVRAEAQKLATALRAGPKTRGRWGEEQLKNVVEMAGMTAYVDFVEQESHDDGERRKQPDMVVRLPGGRAVAVDSKVSLGAYLDAVDADCEEARSRHLNQHAEDLWKHVKSLAAKDYAASLRDSLDYVVMFVPGENYFSAALEARPQLYQDAFDRKILIATPTILVAMLKSAALNWRQEKMTEHAQAVAGMAKDLYDSLLTMGRNLAGVGKALSSAISKYNATIGGYESRVLSRARRFAEYEIPGVETEIETLAPIEEAPRLLRDAGDAPLAAADTAGIDEEDAA